MEGTKPSYWLVGGWRVMGGGDRIAGKGGGVGGVRERKEEKGRVRSFLRETQQ